MNNNKKINHENCDCEHHQESETHSHHQDGKCMYVPDSWADILIENLKKEFESEKKFEID